ncbi:glycosyltransferase 87 family protein, partial [Stenotrophomonas maltophilia]|uniref:glycosyltransferase 87 family protein n=1 Tax=Stenotrophomonas maltophilia TaxID=40324 RepID=UPI0013DD37AA
IRAIAPPVPGVTMVAIGFPAVLVTLGHGHNSFLSAGLIGFGLVLLARRPALAGVLIGLLAFKPQFGLVLPVVLVLGGHWRAALSA